MTPDAPRATVAPTERTQGRADERSGRLWRAVVLAAVAGAALALLVTLVLPDRYHASSTIVVNLNALAAPRLMGDVYASQEDPERLLGNERELVASRTTFVAASEQLGVAPATLEESVSVAVGSASNTLVIIAEAGSEEEALAYTAGIAEAYVADRVDARQARLAEGITAVESELVALDARLATADPGTREALLQEYGRLVTVLGSLKVQAADGRSFANIVEPASQLADNRLGVSPVVGAVVGGVLAAALVLAVAVIRRQTSHLERAETAADGTGMR